MTSNRITSPHDTWRPTRSFISPCNQINSRQKKSQHHHHGTAEVHSQKNLGVGIALVGCLARIVVAFFGGFVDVSVWNFCPRFSRLYIALHVYWTVAIRSRRYRNDIAWSLPSKTVMYYRPSGGKRCGGKKQLRYQRLEDKSNQPNQNALILIETIITILKNKTFLWQGHKKIKQPTATKN